jgi:hypothetical protein
MKIIGIDIAIENLAFCGLDFKESDGLEKVTIDKSEWFVLDTTPDDYKQDCCYINKKKCSKGAGWFYVDKQSGVYNFYCATHKKVVDPQKTKSWKTLNKNYINTNEVIQSMFKILDEKLDYFRSADYIIIEKQPPKNPKMIAIMNYLYSYFVVRLWNDVKKEEWKLKDIVFVDAKNKVNYSLGVLNKEEVEQITQKYNPTKNKYQYYKKVSIACVQKELASGEHKELLDYFNSYKKIDDLADSRNMVLWWISKQFLKKTKMVKEKKEKEKEKEENREKKEKEKDDTVSGENVVKRGRKKKIVVEVVKEVE